jgi:Nucleotide-diphospho-sugar transferase
MFRIKRALPLLLFSSLFFALWMIFLPPIEPCKCETVSKCKMESKLPVDGAITPVAPTAYLSTSFEDAVLRSSFRSYDNRLTVAFTSGNFAIHRFMLNLEIMIKRLHHPFPLLHVPLDEKCLTFMANLPNSSLNILDIGNMKDAFSPDASEFRQKSYNQMALAKWRLALKFLELGVDVFVLDPDLVILRNPVPYFATLPPCDMTFQIDSFANYSGNFVRAHGGFAFEDLGNYHLDNFYNTGFILHRSNPRTIAQIKAYIDHATAEYEKGANADDQNLWNHWIQDFMHYAEVEANAPVLLRGEYAYEKIKNGQCFEYSFKTNSSNVAISINPLTPALFSSRPQIFEVRQLDELLMQPFMWHANWLFGLESKEKIIRENNQWYI